MNKITNVKITSNQLDLIKTHQPIIEKIMEIQKSVQTETFQAINALPLAYKLLKLVKSLDVTGASNKAKKWFGGLVMDDGDLRIDFNQSENDYILQLSKLAIIYNVDNSKFINGDSLDLVIESITNDINRMPRAGEQTNESEESNDLGPKPRRNDILAALDKQKIDYLKEISEIIPGSSASLESSFSILKWLSDGRKSSMKLETMESLMYVRSLSEDEHTLCAVIRNVLQKPEIIE